MKAKVLTKESMQSSIDFIKDNLNLITDEGYKADLEKIINNVPVAQKAMADNGEKIAYLYALYVNNASELGCYLFRNNLLTVTTTEAFYKLPTREEATEAVRYYAEQDEAERQDIMDRQMRFNEHRKGLDVFKGIALGDTPEEAKEGVEQYEQKVGEALNRK